MLTLRQFIIERVEPWAKNTFAQTSPQTLRRWYVPNLKTIRQHDALATRPLDGITSEHVAGFAAYRLTGGLQVSSVNSTLRVLRRCLGLAVEWGLLPAVPKVRLLKGEKSRDRVVSPVEEQLYLAAAPEPLYWLGCSWIRASESGKLSRWNGGTYISQMAGVGQCRLPAGRVRRHRESFP